MQTIIPPVVVLTELLLEHQEPFFMYLSKYCYRNKEKFNLAQLLNWFQIYYSLSEYKTSLH